MFESEKRVADAFLLGDQNIFVDGRLLHFKGAPYSCARFNRIVWLADGRELQLECGTVDGPQCETVNDFVSGRAWHVWLRDSAGRVWDVAPDGSVIEGSETPGIAYRPAPPQTQAILLEMASRACAAHLARMGVPSDVVDVCCASDVGRSLIAKRPYAIGETILEDAAFISVADLGPEARVSLSRKIRQNPCMVRFLLSAFGGSLERVVVALNMRTKHPRGVTGLFPTLNFVNHSCVHNCDLETPLPDRLRLVARAPIAAGEPLTISYVTAIDEETQESLDLAAVWDKSIRRSVLMAQYGFECACESCRDRRD